MYERYVEGEEVWCYDCPHLPRRSKIIKEHSADYWQVEHLSGKDKIRCYGGTQIYRDTKKLINAVRQDAYDLEQYAKKLENIE